MIPIPDYERLRTTLTRLSIPQNRAAVLVGVAPRTLRAWCQPPQVVKRRNVPEPIWRILDLIENVPGTLDRLDDLAKLQLVDGPA